MPKEVIHNASTLEDSFTQVGWSKEVGHVEIATISPSGQVSAFDAASQQFVVVNTTYPGWFQQLDRNGINKLIRVLRRARNDAFGSDE